MLGAVSLRLGREKVRDQFAAATAPAHADPGSFAARLAGELDAALASEDFERLSRHRLVERDRDGVWSVCCPALAAAVERLASLVLTTPTVKEAS